MAATVRDMSVSLDEFIAGPNEGPGNGLGAEADLPYDGVLMPGSGDPSHDGEQDQVLRALTDMVEVLASEHAEIVDMVSAIAAAQGSMLEVLDALTVAADVESPSEAQQSASAGTEALRREANQSCRRTRELIAQSNALIAKAAVLERDAAAIVSGDRRHGRRTCQPRLGVRPAAPDRFRENA